jgi:hypothetical protein
MFAFIQREKGAGEKELQGSKKRNNEDVHFGSLHHQPLVLFAFCFCFSSISALYLLNKQCCDKNR